MRQGFPPDPRTGPASGPRGSLENQKARQCLASFMSHQDSVRIPTPGDPSAAFRLLLSLLGGSPDWRDQDTDLMVDGDRS